MRKLAAACVVAMALVTLASRRAEAQYSIPSQAARTEAARTLQIAADAEPTKRQAHSIPWEMGASLNFLTSDPSLGGESLDFSDVVLLRLHGLVLLADRIEVFGGTDVLPKQPSYTDELGWQGALVGARMALGEHLSTWIRARGGPELDQSGWWLGASGAAQYRMVLQKALFFEAELGGAHTQLFLDQDTARAFYLDELFAKAGIAVRDPKHDRFRLWLTFDYFYPIVSGPDRSSPDPDSGLFLDPQPRVNFHLGTLLAVSETVSLFMEWSILDRGDLENPATTLPILNGGFDQKQLLFGFARRFGRDS